MEVYSRKNHLDWCDLNNVGVSLFGLHPEELRRDNIRFDIFHLQCAITRRLMSNLRKFMLTTTTEMMETFSSVLLKFWTMFNVLAWNMNWPFTSFLGVELLHFIHNTDIIMSFLKDNFCDTDTLHDLCDGLLLWKDISPFLVIVHIDNVLIYNDKLQSFVACLKRFYEIGKRSFLTKHVDRPGSDESFYMHALRFYMPMLATKTLHNHHIGLGIYKMQGYGRCNKESKNTLRCFCNHKGNIILPNIRRLWDIFYQEQNAY